MDFVNMLRALEHFSNCSRRHVACILEGPDGFQVGINGSTFPVVGCERPLEQGNCGCMHAEVDAALSYDFTFDVQYVWLTCAPCAPCAKVLARLTPRVVYYLEDNHPMLEGFKVLDAAGIKHIKVA